MKNSTLPSRLLTFALIMMFSPVFIFAQSGSNNSGGEEEDAFIGHFYENTWTDTEDGLVPQMIATPNPATGENLRVFYAQLQGTTQLALYDLSGRLIVRDQIGQNNKTSGVYNFQMATLTPGIYFVRMASGNQKNVQKVVVR